MSKRLQISLTDQGYDTLLKVTEALHGAKKSTAIECAIFEFYGYLIKCNVIGDKKEPCQ